MAMTRRPAAVADHPLAPLTLEEAQEAVRIVREERQLGPKHRFAGLTLNEPPKEQVLAFAPGGVRPGNRARAPIYNRSN